VQGPGGKAARELTAPAADLEHLITGPDTRDLTRLINEFVGIHRADAVILSRYLIKDFAVLACIRHWRPGHPGTRPMIQPNSETIRTPRPSVHSGRIASRSAASNRS